MSMKCITRSMTDCLPGGHWKKTRTSGPLNTMLYSGWFLYFKKAVNGRHQVFCRRNQLVLNLNMLCFYCFFVLFCFSFFVCLFGLFFILWCCPDGCPPTGLINIKMSIYIHIRCLKFYLISLSPVIYVLCYDLFWYIDHCEIDSWPI